MAKNSQKSRSLRENEKKKVTARRLKRFGKMARAPEEIPAKVALRNGLSSYARPREKPKITSISKVKGNLKRNEPFLG